MKCIRWAMATSGRSSPSRMRTLASGAGKWEDKAEAGQLKLWDVASGAERGVLEGHKSIVAGLSFARDGKTLISCGWDGISTPTASRRPRPAVCSAAPTR